jgi:hypothetical protein
MAKTTAAIEVEVLPKGGADTVVKNFKTQLREAKLEAQQMVITFGEFSIEALAAQKKVAELADKMDDFNDRVKALNPDKFAKVQTVVQGISRGFQVGQGAMALFGAESEDLQKQLVKVQGAMALADGLEGLGKVQQQFKTLAKDGIQALVKSFSTLKGAIISTGIGVLVIALGYLIANFDKLGFSVKSDADHADDLAKSNDALKDSIDLTNKSIEAETDLLKAQGASLQQINDLKIKSLEIANEILRGGDAEMAVRSASISQLFTNLNYEMTESEQAAYDKIEKIREENRIQVTKNEATILNLKAEVIKEGEDLATKAADTAKAKRKEEEAKQKDASTKQLKAIQDRNDAARKLDELNATEGLDFITTQYANNLSHLKEAKAQELSQENLTQNAILAIKAKYATLIQTNEIQRVKAVDDFTKANRDKFIAAELAATQKQFQDQINFVKIRDKNLKDQSATNQEIADLEIKSLEEQLATKKKFGEDTTAIEQQILDKKRGIRDTDLAEQEKKAAKEKEIETAKFQAVNDSLGAIGEIYSAFASTNEEDQKKAFEVNKATSIAQAIVNTWEGVTAALANKTQLFPGQNLINAGLSLAAGLVAVKKISDTTYQSKSTSGSSPSQASGQGTMQSFAPRMSSLNQNESLTQNRKVYVTEGDITRTQRRVSNNKAISVVE